MPRSLHRVFGIDPGLARCGWAVVETIGGTPRLAASGCLITPANQPESGRLNALYGTLVTLLNRYAPERAALERLYFTTNVSTAMTVGQARGVALLALGQANIPIIELTPTSIKQAVAGYGRADKKQMQRMVATLLRLPRIPSSDDEADAMAVALCASTMQITK